MKSIITREWAEKELRFYNRADVRYTLVLTFTFWLIFAPCTVLAVCASLSSSLYGHTFFGILLTFLGAACLSTPCWISLVVLFQALAERKMLQKGEFDIELCPLSYKHEEAFRHGLREFFNFSDFKKLEVPHSVYLYAAPGDEYYIIHYRNKKTISLLYPSAIYEYKEN